MKQGISKSSFSLSSSEFGIFWKSTANGANLATLFQIKSAPLHCRWIQHEEISKLQNRDQIETLDAKIGDPEFYVY